MSPAYAFQYTPMDKHHIRFRDSNIGVDYLTWLEQHRPSRPAWYSLTTRPPLLQIISTKTGADMLNARKLSEFLTKNVDQHLIPTMFIMSPNGTLLAYTTPANIKDLRDEATVVSMAWKEYLNKPDASPKESGNQTSGAIGNEVLETLSVQIENKNIVAKAVQPNLLLVMVGGHQPFAKQDFKITPEYKGDPRYPSTELSDPPPNWDTLSEMEKDVKLGVLHIQRKKIDKIVQFIRDELESDNFVMPDDGQFK